MIKLAYISRGSVLSTKTLAKTFDITPYEENSVCVVYWLFSAMKSGLLVNIKQKRMSRQKTDGYQRFFRNERRLMVSVTVDSRHIASTMHVRAYKWEFQNCWYRVFGIE